ncbi:MAG: hypothetical protein LLF94_11375, partial [Chlamydiales bacterium]|nr:hypothetical protein [Chlamydiales bacterium]
MRIYQLLFSFLCLFATTLHSVDYEDVYKEIASHMLPERYLVKQALDEIMASSKTSVFHDL